MFHTHYGFWNYWELYHKVTFDGVNRLILINDGETEIDFQVDVYSSWKEWALLEQNLKYTTPFQTIGGEPTVAGQRLDVTYFLINGWKIKPYPGSYNLTIIGNVFDVDGGDIKVPADVIDNVANNISINTNTSVIVRQINSSTGGLTDTQDDALFDIQGRVISIESILSSPITASLESSQLNILNDINVNSTYNLDLTISQSIIISNLQTMLDELYQIHGLKSGTPVEVTQTQRTVGSLVQTFDTVGSGSSQSTTITRVP